MNLLMLLIAVIAVIAYIFAIKWVCGRFKAEEYTNLFVILGVIVFVLFLCKSFGVFNMLASVQI